MYLLTALSLFFPALQVRAEDVIQAGSFPVSVDVQILKKEEVTILFYTGQDRETGYLLVSSSEPCCLIPKGETLVFPSDRGVQLNAYPAYNTSRGLLVMGDNPRSVGVNVWTGDDAEIENRYQPPEIFSWLFSPEVEVDLVKRVINVTPTSRFDWLAKVSDGFRVQCSGKKKQRVREEKKFVIKVLPFSDKFELGPDGGNVRISPLYSHCSAVTVFKDGERSFWSRGVFFNLTPRWR